MFLPRGSALILWVSLLSPLFGGEAVYFKSGFRLEVDSHSVSGQKLIAQIGAGTLEFPAAEIDRVEIVPEVASPSKTRPEPVAAVYESPEMLVTNAANNEQLPPEFVRSVAKVESGFRQDAVSSKGALGLMQLMPGTAVELGVDATRAQENAKGGAKYLRDLLIRYRGDSALALAAYNAGPGAVSKFRGVPPYPETRRYVVRVLQEYQRQKSKAQMEASRQAPGLASKPSAID